MADNIAPPDATNNSAPDVSGKETLIFNVGGMIFETYRSTLLRMPKGPLVDNNILKEHFRPEKNDFFFDRDPDAFKLVVNRLRSGQVTIPAGISDPSMKYELIFWGLTPNDEQSKLTQPPVSLGNNVHVGASSGSTTREGTGNKIWNILSNPSTSLLAKLYAGLSYFLMVLSVFILVAETTTLFHVTRPNDENSTHEADYRRAKTRSPYTHYAVDIVALVCCLFFLIEYILRFVFAPNRLRFVFSFLGVIDLLAVLPTLVLSLISLLMTGPLSLTFLRLLRIFPILRILRIFKHFKMMMRTEIIVRTLKSSVGELVLLVSLMVIGVLVWGTLAYDLEDEDVGYGYIYESIPKACWWAVVTMTTVGYGDIFPVTPLAKMVGSLCAVSGLLLIGLCVAVLISNMSVCMKGNQATGNYQSTETGKRIDMKCSRRSEIDPDNRGIVE